MRYVSSSSQIVNANRVQIHALAYNLFNWFRRLVLPEPMRTDRIDTVRLKLLKIAVRIVRSARYVHFKLCSFCPFQDLFSLTLFNIYSLRPQLEQLLPLHLDSFKAITRLQWVYCALFPAVYLSYDVPCCCPAVRF